MTYRPISEKERAQREQDIREITAWKEAAVADGWEIEPTYENESVERAFRLHKEGFLAQGITRPMSDEGAWPVGSLSIWGPDGLAVMPGRVYDWEFLQRGLRYCDNCDTHDVDTVRISFAGRCCETCLPGLRKIHERPGWISRPRRHRMAG